MPCTNIQLVLQGWDRGGGGAPQAPQLRSSAALPKSRLPRRADCCRSMPRSRTLADNDQDSEYDDAATEAPETRNSAPLRRHAAREAAMMSTTATSVETMTRLTTTTTRRALSKLPPAAAPTLQVASARYI